MKNLTPWAEPPTGSGVAYAIRYMNADLSSPLATRGMINPGVFVFRHNGKSFRRSLQVNWPKAGYVASTEWTNRQGGPGLYGLLDGRGWPPLYILLEQHPNEYVAQLLCVKRSECVDAVPSDCSRYVKFPRCWVMLTGNIVDIMQALIPCVLMDYFEQGGFAAVDRFLADDTDSYFNLWGARLGILPNP